MHGNYFSVYVRLSDTLQEVAEWANPPGHEKEIILLQVEASPDSDHPASQVQLGTICRAFVGATRSL